jgi:cytochrome c oxidase subunit II
VLLEGEGYRVVCAELCGIGHATMRAPVEVHAPEDWEDWVAEQQDQQGGQQDRAPNGDGAGGGS